MRPKWTHVKFNFPRYLKIVRFSWFLHNFRVFYDRAGFSVNQKYWWIVIFGESTEWENQNVLCPPANQTVSRVWISKIFFLRIIRLEFPKNNLSMVRVSYYCVRLKDLTPLRCHMITVHVTLGPSNDDTMIMWLDHVMFNFKRSSKKLVKHEVDSGQIKLLSYQFR